jgi:hypothetical protein
MIRFSYVDVVSIREFTCEKDIVIAMGLPVHECLMKIIKTTNQSIEFADVDDNIFKEYPNIDSIRQNEIKPLELSSDSIKSEYMYANIISTCIKNDVDIPYLDTNILYKVCDGVSISSISHNQKTLVMRGSYKYGEIYIMMMCINVY